MSSPWLAIPLSDYEGHMASPGVAQAQMLETILARVAGKFAPASVAVPGCAGGNGFSRISPAVTRRVVGVDLNPRYIEATRTRFEGLFQDLELHVADIERDALAIAPVELVFAALILEYMDIDVAMARMVAMLGARGRLVTVVQLPDDSSGNVTPSPYASLRALGEVMRLVPPREVLRAARSQGLVQRESQTAVSAVGKRFEVQVFTAE